MVTVRVEYFNSNDRGSILEVDSTKPVLRRKNNFSSGIYISLLEQEWKKCASLQCEWHQEVLAVKIIIGETMEFRSFEHVPWKYRQNNERLENFPQWNNRK